MRVALVTYALHVGGMESFLFALARGLRAAGFEVEFVVTETVGEWHDLPRQDGFVTHTVLPSATRGRRQHAVQVARRLTGYDTVLLNHSRAAQAALGLLPQKVAAISILHNDFDPIYRVGLANQANIDGIVCVNQRVYDEAIRRGGAASRTPVIPYGVPVPAHWPKIDDKWDERPLSVVYLGRVDNYQKGVFDLPPVLAGAMSLGCRLSFDLIGDGPDLETLRALLAEKCAGIDARCHGALPHMRAMEILAQSDVLLMPSRFEGLPIALLEAMAHGVVPVASLLPGVTDVPVQAGENGLLLPVGDVSAFAEAIASLTDKPTWRRMSERAWATAMERFSERRMCQQYASLICETVGERRAGRPARRNGRLDATLFGVEFHLPTALLDRARPVVQAWRKLLKISSR